MTDAEAVFRSMHDLLEGIAQIAENHGFRRGDDLQVWLSQNLSRAPRDHRTYLAQKVRNLLPSAGSQFEAASIVQALPEHTPKAVYNALGGLAATGELTKVAYGVYRVAQPDRLQQIGALSALNGGKR